MNLIKSLALGNDFLLIDGAEIAPRRDVSALARDVCERDRGIGADGLLIFTRSQRKVSMRLLNADGSPSEISGNGLRCLAAYMVWSGRRPARHVVHTVSGPRPVEVTETGRARYRIATGLGEEVTECARRYSRWGRRA